MVARRTASDPAMQAVGPDSSVMRALRTAGAREVEIPGAPSWWILPGQEQARTWQEAMQWMAECVSAQRRAQLTKPAHQTTEFWMALASILGAIGTALASLSDGGITGPLAPYLIPLAGAISVMVPVGYKFARQRAKDLAALEGTHAHEQPAKSPNDSAT